MFSGLENPYHLLILGVIVLLVFGPKRLPAIGRSLGSGIRNFRHGLAADESADDSAVEPTVTDRPSQPPASSSQPPST